MNPLFKKASASVEIMTDLFDAGEALIGLAENADTLIGVAKRRRKGRPTDPIENFLCDDEYEESETRNSKIIDGDYEILDDDYIVDDYDPNNPKDI
jgi:hypothetical protein